MNLTNNSNYEITDKIELKLENKIDYVCFYKNIELIILFSQGFSIVEDINNNETLFTHKDDYYSNIFTDFLRKDGNKFYINILRLSYIETFSFQLKNNKDIIICKGESNNLYPQKFKKIYVKPYLDFTNSIIDKGDINKKSYLDIKEIIQDLHDNYSLSLEAKKENVNKKKDDYNNDDTIYNKYIFLVKLLIQDNTNKDVLKLYLKLLQNNQEFFKNNYYNLENFEIEYPKYKVLFSKDEIKTHFNLEKESEENEFFNFLYFIQEKEDNNEILNKCKTIHLGVFNQGIEYNNQELFWFRNKALLVYAIKKMTNNEIKLMKYCVNKIIEKELFKNPIIYNNYIYITLLIFLMIKPLEENNCIDNLNLIESLFKNKIENIGINKNLILDENNSVKLLNYKQAYDIFDESIKIDKIKKFLKKIFCSNVIKEAFQILYPFRINFPFQTEKDAETYINKYINFVVLYKPKSNGMTDKFSLDTFIFLKQKKMAIRNVKDNILKELLIKILYTAGIIKTNFHELNHNFYNIFYYHENGNIPLKTPRKDGLNFREGGREMELLLFGNILDNINIKQALYILNENNYQKNIFQFKEDFENLYKLNEKKDDYVIVGEFSEYNNLPDNVLDETSQFFIAVNLEDSEKNIYFESYDNDDNFGAD